MTIFFSQPLPTLAARSSRAAGVVDGAPRALLRLEGAAILAGALIAYGQVGPGWSLFAMLVLLPDLSMLAYLGGARLGAWGYNLGHSYIGPIALAAAGAGFGQSGAWGLALIWIAHIGFDRMLGYGLKYEAGFGHTHLGLKGKARAGE